MPRKTKRDSDWAAEVVFSVLEFPEELWLITVVIGVVFGLIWLLGAVFRSFFGEA
jgi:hypothetical protein